MTHHSIIPFFHHSISFVLFNLCGEGFKKGKRGSGGKLHLDSEEGFLLNHR